jgi:hypothetical protein
MEPSFEHSIAYCDRALLVLDEYPQYWVRRISVMQSRAMHRLIAADADGAIEDLDSADALAPEPLNADYVRTLDVNARLIRALALTMKGEHAAGEALALEARLQRPYARAVLVAALMVLSQRGEIRPDGACLGRAGASRSTMAARWPDRSASDAWRLARVLHVDARSRCARAPRRGRGVIAQLGLDGAGARNQSQAVWRGTSAWRVIAASM